MARRSDPIKREQLLNSREVNIPVYSKIMVPLDGSDLAELALAPAQLVASALSIPMELVQAFNVLPPAVHNRSTRMALEQMLAEQKRRSERYLSQVQERLQPSGCRLTTAALAGWPEQAIVDRAGEDPDALIVMTTHGRGGLARWAMGSVASWVLHTVSNPVLIVRASAAEVVEAEVRTILVPLDGSDLAEMSLEHASDLAAALGASVSLVRATHTRQYYRSRVAGPVVATGQSPESWINELMGDEADEATNYLIQVERRLAAERPEIDRVETLHLLHDSPAQAIIDRASAQPTLVVMTSHGRGGLGRMLLGSVTDRVVRHSNAPVLVIRPRTGGRAHD